MGSLSGSPSCRTNFTLLHVQEFGPGGTGGGGGMYPGGGGEWVPTLGHPPAELGQQDPGAPSLIHLRQGDA